MYLLDASAGDIDDLNLKGAWDSDLASWGCRCLRRDLCGYTLGNGVGDGSSRKSESDGRVLHLDVCTSAFAGVIDTVACSNTQVTTND